MKSERRVASAASWHAYLDRLPIVVAIAGPNGVGKSTFFEAHLKSSGLRFLNADLRTPFRQVAAFVDGRRVKWNEPTPSWLKSVL